MSAISVSVVTINASETGTEEVERGRIEIMGDFAINESILSIHHT